MDRKQQIEHLKNLPDEAIDFSDVPEAMQLTGWEPNPFFKPVKGQLSAKLDKDLIAWLKLHGEVSKFLNRIVREKMLEERVGIKRVG